MNICDKCLHDCVCQEQDVCGLMGLCSNYAEKPRFKPGDKVWAVVRSVSGEALEVIGYMFLAEAAGLVILASSFHLFDPIKVALANFVQETRRNFRTELLVFPSADCYATKKEADAAFRREVN